MEYFDHVTHKHPLTLYDQKHEAYGFWTCEGCKTYITSGDFYGCEGCVYYICTSCYKLPRELRHPFHIKDHPLTLLAKSPYKLDDDDPDSSVKSAYCNACSESCYGFFYHCSECQFDLDIKCATLMPKKKNYNYYYASTSHQEEELEEQQFTHPHPLIACDREDKEVDIRCSVCEQPIKKGTIYVCLHCGTIMDKSCAQLPQQITHHFHPHHSLTLKDDSPYASYGFHSRCNACPDFKGRFRYSCSDCEFSLDIRCASLKPKAMVTNHLQVPFNHPHALIPCDATNGNFSFSCSACEITIEEGTVLYVCLECRLFLHKSCLELPRKIEHPFHPHPLVLLDNIDKDYKCNACYCLVDGFKYWCAPCDFAMDVTCASASYLTFKLELHQHPLAFFNEDKRKKICFVQCNSCKGILGFPFFRCVPCNFSIKFCCLPILPRTFKHSHHQHSLSLTHDPIKDHSDDDDDSEYYCDFCEEIRRLSEPTYCCMECHYVAHISCVFDEILPSLQERELSLPAELKASDDPAIVALDEEIVMLGAQIDPAKLETLATKFNELTERRAQHSGDYQIDHSAIAKLDEEIGMVKVEGNTLTAEMERVETKLGELWDRRQHLVGYQIGIIPSLGTRSSVAVVDHSDHEVVEEDCNVKNTEEEEDQESDGTSSTIAELDDEIKAITAKLEALKTTRASHVKRKSKHEWLKESSS